MRRWIILAPAVVLLAALAIAGAFLVIHEAGNTPTPTVAARELAPGAEACAAPDNAALDSPDPRPEPKLDVTADKPAPERQPAPEENKPADKPKPKSRVNQLVDALKEAARTGKMDDLLQKASPTELMEAAKVLQKEMMKSAATVNGRVVDASGAGVARASVYAKSEDAAYRRRNAPAQVVATTDKDGNYSAMLPTLGADSTKITMYAQDKLHLPSDSRSLEIAQDQTYSGIDFTVKQAASITGRVVDQDFNPVKNARVVAYTAGLRGRRMAAPAHMATTDADGRFTIGGLTAGNYTVSVSCSGYRPYSGGDAVAVSEGTPTALPSDIALTRVTAVRIKLTSDGSTPHGYFRVKYFQSDGHTGSGYGVADASGEATVVNPPKNAYEMVITINGYKPSEHISITVTDGAHTDAGEVKLEAGEQLKEYDGKDDTPLRGQGHALPPGAAGGGPVKRR